MIYFLSDNHADEFLGDLKNFSLKGKDGAIVLKEGFICSLAEIQM